MELYALAALTGLGIWFNAQRKPVQMLQGPAVGAVPSNASTSLSTSPSVSPSGSSGGAKTALQPRIVPGEQPSMTDLYNSTYSQKAAGIEAARASMKFQQSLRTKETGVVSAALPKEQQGAATAGGTRFSALAGVEIPVEEFTHNNMQPFYRGSVKQNVDPFAISTTLENLSGSVSSFRSKREVEATSFFVPQPGLTNAGYGTPNQTQQMRDFIVEPRARNNEFPIERQTVGPGIAAGFSSTPQDVYVAQREYAMPRGTDEIRAANKPKLTYDARVLDGVKVALGASTVGKVEKRTPDFFKCNSEQDLLPTTGATLKERKEPDQIMLRDTAKPALHQPYAGNAFLRKDQTLEAPVEAPSAAPRRENFGAVNVGPAGAGGRWSSDKGDYGKSSIRVYTTLREVTEAKARAGNIGTAFKSLIAPLQDLVKTSKKETLVDAGREFGNVQPAIPGKMTVYDPNAVARTTIKETALQESTAGNVRPSVYKITVYDPADVARVTMRQTLRSTETLGSSLAPHRYVGQAQDPSSVARTTLKETALQESMAGNLAAHRYTQPAYDPNDIAKTTLKETSLQESAAGNLAAHRYTQPAYDPNDIAKTTLKETALQESQQANLATHQYRAAQYAQDAAKVTGRQLLPDEDPQRGNVLGSLAQMARDPNAVARTTIKEALVNDEGPGASTSVGGLQGRRGGYQVSAADAKQTQKQILSDVEYYGQPASEGADGYRTAQTEAKQTQKQVLSDIEYYGASESATKKALSLDQYVNARVNELRELVLEGREPTEQGAKVFQDSLGEVANNRQLLEPVADEYANVERVDHEPSAASGLAEKEGCSTRARNMYRELDRLDDELLAQLQQLETNDVAQPRFDA